MDGIKSHKELEALPDDLYVQLVNGLFQDRGALVMGSAATCLAAATIAIRLNSLLAWAYLAAMTLTAALRLKTMIAHGKLEGALTAPQAHYWERNYVVGAAGYMALLAIWTLDVFRTTDDGFARTLALMATVGHALGIATRNFTILSGARIQLVAMAVPLSLAFIIAGGAYPLLIPLVLIPLCVFIAGSASRLRLTFLGEMLARRRAVTLANRFDVAINNMSHGMCMLSADSLIQVSNGKFAEFFGLASTRVIDGVKLSALLRLAARSGKISEQDRARLMRVFQEPFADSEETALQIETSGGGVCDMTIKRNANGGWVVVVQDVTEKRQAERVIDHMARFDAVTNLRNRRSFEMALTQTLADDRTTGARTEVLFLDLDGFKQVNDTLGHKTGDRVLAEAAARLTALSGENDLIARWGGDEFVILRRARPENVDVETFADKVIAELSLPSTIDGAEVVVGASVGISVAEGGLPDMDVVLQQADMALYAAKREARGRFRLYEEAMSETASARRLLELDLQAALASRAFELHYQPIVNVQTQAIVSFEALARWRHPTRGQVSPALFVPVLEELNLMNRFGEWALQRACDDAAKWPVAVRVGVNVSAKQLESDTLYDSVVRALERSGMSPRRLELEITETALLRGADSVSKTLEKIRALGVKIALDDFGTGFSSLSHLMRLPLDKVKIDQSFTRRLGQDRKAEVLIENIARLSSQLGMVVTVEGIETREQLEHVKGFGSISEGQGYLFSKPLSLKDVTILFPPEARQHVA